MFIHIGGDHVLPLAEIIMIMEYSHKGMEEKLQDLIQKYERIEKMIWISKPDTKSLVLTDEYLYASPKSPSTIKNKYMRVRLNEVNNDDYRGTLSGTYL